MNLTHFFKKHTNILIYIKMKNNLYILPEYPQKNPPAQ